MATKLGDLAVGSIVKLNVGGVAKNFIVVHQGLPGSMYDASCDGTWLLMEDIYEERQWDFFKNATYRASAINSYLNGDFKNLLDTDIKNQIKTVKIPYFETSSDDEQNGADGHPTNILLLSSGECGFSGRNANWSYYCGSCLAYFSGTAVIGSDPKRIAYLNGKPREWWTRSISTTDDEYRYANYISGAGSLWTHMADDVHGIRPAMVMPSELYLGNDGFVLTKAPSMALAAAIDGVSRYLSPLVGGVDGVARELQAAAVIDGIQRDIF